MTEPITVSFEVLFRTPGSGKRPTAETRAQFRPDPAAVQLAQRWLEGKGVTCHPTGFSLACTASTGVFKSLFGGKHAPRVPAELAPWVEDVNVPPPPELF